MGQETATGDLIFGILVTAGFLAFCVGAGYLLYRVKNARLSRAWAPLAPIVGGRVHGDGGGAATSTLVGQYRGHAVRAQMVPQRAWGGSVGGTSGHVYNSFDLALGDVAGAQDWRVEYRTPALGLGREGWEVVAADAALAERLRARDVVGLVGLLGWPALPAGLPPLAYSARERTLLLRTNAGPDWVPGAEPFQQMLETLLALAAVNAAANAPAPGRA